MLDTENGKFTFIFILQQDMDLKITSKKEGTRNDENEGLQYTGCPMKSPDRLIEHRAKGLEHDNSFSLQLHARRFNFLTYRKENLVI